MTDRSVPRALCEDACSSADSRSRDLKTPEELQAHVCATLDQLTAGLCRDVWASLWCSNWDGHASGYPRRGGCANRRAVGRRRLARHSSRDVARGSGVSAIPASQALDPSRAQL